MTKKNRNSSQRQRQRKQKNKSNPTSPKVPPLLSLPAELLLEIASLLRSNIPYPYYQDLRLESASFPVDCGWELEENCFSIQSLSRTCQTLRSICLPLAWESIDVCSFENWTELFTLWGDDPEAIEAFHAQLMTKRLLAVMDVIACSPLGLAEYVRSVIACSYKWHTGLFKFNI